MRDFVLVMKAAGDPMRARIIKLLEAGELRVSDLTAALGASQSTVSSHLSVLKKAGLVESRKDSRWVYYSLASRKENPYSLPLLALLLSWLDDDPLVQADRKALAAAVREKGADGENGCVSSRRRRVW